MAKRKFPFRRPLRRARYLLSYAMYYFSIRVNSLHRDDSTSGAEDTASDEFQNRGSTPNTDTKAPQHTVLTVLSPLSSRQSTPVSGETPYPTRPAGVYNDNIPRDSAFWVEVNPMPDDFDRHAFQLDGKELSVVEIFGTVGEGEDVSYEVRFEDGHTATVSPQSENTLMNQLPVHKILSYRNGSAYLEAFMNRTNVRRRLRKAQADHHKPKDRDISESELSEDELARSDSHFDRTRSKRQRTLKILSQKARRRRLTRSVKLSSLGDRYREDESDITLSDTSSRVATRRSARTVKPRSSLRYTVSDISDSEDEVAEDSEGPSERTSRSSARPKVKKAAEEFPIDNAIEFARRHHYWCMSSSDLTVINSDAKRLAMCQGCSFMHHVECLGQKAERQRVGHNVIVLDERDGKRICVLQCGRCNGKGKIGVITMRCLACGEIGGRCGQFKHPDKMKGAENQESFLRGWNDASKVMFRCMGCERACHFHHLPLPVSGSNASGLNQAEKLNGGANDRKNKRKSDSPNVAKSSNGVESAVTSNDLLKIYTSEYWRCNECREYNSKKVDVVLGWRPTNTLKKFLSDVPTDFTREYLIKFEYESYARALWVPATWLSGVSFVMKSNFDAKQTSAIEWSKDVVPDAWLRPDIIFDVTYEDDSSREQMRFRTESTELEAISRVTWVLCKWQKLRYEESITRYMSC